MRSVFYVVPEQNRACTQCEFVLVICRISFSSLLSNLQFSQTLFHALNVSVSALQIREFSRFDNKCKFHDLFFIIPHRLVCSIDRIPETTKQKFSNN